jgi:hypothetical protein
MYIHSVTSSVGLPVGRVSYAKASMAGWDALCIPTVLTALPDHALLRSGAMAARKGEGHMMEGSVMGEEWGGGEVDPTSALASLLTLSLFKTGAAPLASPSQKYFARASGQTRCNPPSDRRVNWQLLGSWPAAVPRLKLQ